MGKPLMEILGMTDKPTRGGLRSPAGGRPRKAPADRKVKLSITLSKDLAEKLREKRTRPNEPLSQVIERLLRDS